MIRFRGRYRPKGTFRGAKKLQECQRSRLAAMAQNVSDRRRLVRRDHVKIVGLCRRGTMPELIGGGEANVQAVNRVNEVFVVDDNDDYRELLATILELEGHHVIPFPEGTSFLKQVATKTPVCVFLDVIMPGPSGIEILKKLNARSFAAPIFLISGRNESAVVVEAMKYGAQDFIEKAFDPYTAVLRVR